MRVVHVDVRESDDRDISACSIQRRGNVVNLCEVRGPQREKAPPASGELWLNAPICHFLELAQHMLHRLRREIVQGYEPRHHRRQRFRNLRIANIGLPRFSPHHELMNLRPKCIPDLPCVSAELDHASPRGHFDSRESLRGQPARHRLNVCVSRPVPPSELLRRQPMLKIRRFLTHLLGHELLQRRFLLRASLQQQLHPLHRRRIAYRSLIKLRSRQSMHVSL